MLSTNAVSPEHPSTLLQVKSPLPQEFSGYLWLSKVGMSIMQFASLHGCAQETPELLPLLGLQTGAHLNPLV